MKNTSWPCCCRKFFILYWIFFKFSRFVYHTDSKNAIYHRDSNNFNNEGTILLVCWNNIVSNYPNENTIHLGVGTSHLQHTILDTRPTIRLDPSSTLGFAKPRWVDLLDSSYGSIVPKRIQLNLKGSILEPLYLIYLCKDHRHEIANDMT